jgi:hypothetical protein
MNESLIKIVVAAAISVLAIVIEILVNYQSQ